MDWKNTPAKLRFFLAAVVAAAVPVYVWSVVRLIELRSVMTVSDWFSLAGLTTVACLTSRWVVRIPRTNTWMAVADCLIITLLMIYGLAAGVVASGLLHLVSYRFVTWRGHTDLDGKRKIGWRTSQAIFNTAAAGLYAFGYGAVYWAFLPRDLVYAHQIVIPVVLLAGTYFLLNASATQAINTLLGRSRFWTKFRQDFPLVPLYFLASASGAAVIFFFHRVAGGWAFLLSVPILLVVYYAHRFYNEKYEELSRLYFETVQAFALSIDALELHTDYKHHTANHIQRTQRLTLGLARALGVDQETHEALRFASVLHDVGKISIPSYILHKPTRLTEREFQKMSTHPSVGAQILSSISFTSPVIPIVRHHHENWDGSGYPDGLKGLDIPLGARILAVADCYEALTARRVYRRPLDRETALSIMKRESQKFDPRVFAKFLEIIDELEEEMNKAEVRELKFEAKEFQDKKRMPDIVGVPEAKIFTTTISAHQREVFNLFEILQTIGSSLSRNDTLTIIAAKLEKIVPFNTLVIYLLDDSRGVLTPAFAIGQNAEHFKRLSIEVGTRLAGWVAANNRILYNVHPGPDTMLLPEEVRGQYQVSMLAPLAHEDRPLGTIALYWSEAEKYDDDHVRMMEIVANRSSIALYNAIKFEETQEDAFTDRLTGLANSRFLYIFFEQTLSEAKRYGEPLTLMELDLDDFKSVNDRYGHHVGDRFLKEVGRILKSRMRESDVLVRYAGDEFIAILPKTNLDQARQFSYRLQDAVEASVIDVGGGTLLSVGLSLGLAAFPSEGSDLESLLMAADKNMYEHKSRRKARRRRAEEGEGGGYQPSLFEPETVAPTAENEPSPVRKSLGPS
jgi:diguanylate cyclase (GGDEF)-like protein/putative nucleotidyltransferase with HDIG domain